MSLKEDPLEKVYYFKVVDWFQSKILLSRCVCGFMLIFLAIFPLSLFREKVDIDRMCINFAIAFLPSLALIIAYLITITDYTDLTRKANEKFRSILSEDAATYDRITRSNRKVSLWLWNHFLLILIVSITANFYKGVRSQLIVYDMIEGSITIEGLITFLVLSLWSYLVIVIALQARWCYYIWVQMVLLEGYVRRNLGSRINRDDKERQELCGRRLRKVVILHSDIKSVANDLFEKIVRVNVILLFFPVVCACTTSILFVFTNKSNGVKLVSIIFGMSALYLVNIVVMNIQSTSDQSEKLCKVLYDCPWYDWNKGNCTSLIIIMSVMKEPLLKFRIYGIFELNRTLFLKVFRVSYALLTTVLNLQ